MAVSGRLRSKLVWTMLFVLILVGIATILLVVFIQYQSTKRHLASIENHIMDSIVSKGKVLAENHALALKGLVADNAFSDVSELVDRAVKEDSDIVYGLFMNNDNIPWAYYSPTTKSESNQRDARSELSLPEHYGKIATSTSRKTNLFGHEIFEVAVPVIDADERLGVVIYGLSLTRIRDSVKEARNESMESLTKTIGLIVVLVIMITIVGIAVSSRQAKKITNPLLDLTTAANKLASGNMGVRVDITSGDELETLGATFNQMVSDLSKTYAELETLNRTLEQKVLSRTAELSSRNRDMRLVLDNIDQGLITIDKNCIMTKERSAEIDKWFGSYEEGTIFVNYLARLDQNLSEWFELGFEALWEDFLPLDVCIDQLPHRLKYNNREYLISYRPIFTEDNHELSGLLVVFADITEKLALERKEELQREVLNVFSRVMYDRTGYALFEKETDMLIQKIVSGAYRDDLARLKRAIHTLKGNCSLVGINTISNLCHSIEEEIHESCCPPSETQIRSLKRAWSRLKEKTFAFSNFGENTIEIGQEDYETLLEKVYTKVPYDQILNDLVWFHLEPVEKQFFRIREQAFALATRLKKGDIDIEISHGNLRVDTEYWMPFWGALSHVIRNAVDHGFETNGEDPASETFRKPTINLKASVHVDDFIIEVGDNGRGINWEKVAATARKKGLPSDKKSDLVEAIFTDGFSTRDSITDVSGRGIGMAALRESLNKMNGRVELKSEAGQGTIWKFSFPRAQMHGNIWNHLEERVIKTRDSIVSDQFVAS